MGNFKVLIVGKRTHFLLVFLHRFILARILLLTIAFLEMLATRVRRFTITVLLLLWMHYLKDTMPLFLLTARFDLKFS